MSPSEKHFLVAPLMHSSIPDLELQKSVVGSMDQSDTAVLMVGSEESSKQKTTEWQKQNFVCFAMM